MYVLVGTMVHVLTSLARHVVLAGIGAGAGRDRLMSGIYNCTLFVYLYICIDYSGGSGCCVRACEPVRYSGTWNVVYEVFFFFFLFFFVAFFLGFGFDFGFGFGRGKGKEKEKNGEKKGRKKALTIDGL